MPEISEEEFQLYLKFQKEYDYHVPREVENIVVYGCNYSFPICPRCEIALERDYQAFCDRCGQKLKWDVYHKGKAKACGSQKVKN